MVATRGKGAGEVMEFTFSFPGVLVARLLWFFIEELLVSFVFGKKVGVTRIF